MKVLNAEQVASNLYAGGWRAEDQQYLIREYDLSQEEADALCALLTEYERKEGNV